MPYLYELAVLGEPTQKQINDLEQCIWSTVELFGMQLHREVAWEVCPAAFNPSQQSVAAAVFFGGPNAPQKATQVNLTTLLQNNIPILPVISDLTAVSNEIPS